MSFNIGDMVVLKDAAGSGVPQHAGKVGRVSYFYDGDVGVIFEKDDFDWICLTNELSLVKPVKPVTALATAQAAIKALSAEIRELDIVSVFPHFDIAIENTGALWLYENAFSHNRQFEDIPKLVAALRAAADLLDSAQ